VANVAAQRARFRTAAILMAIVSALAIVYLISPWSVSSGQKQQELLDKQKQLREAESQTRPLQQLPQLVAKSQSDIAEFYADRLPAYPSTVYNAVYELAQKNNVRLNDVKYEVFDTDPYIADLQLLQVQATVNGSYPDLVKFINSVERSKLFFVIDGLQLGSRQASGVGLNVTMETYLRPREPNEKPQVASAKNSEEEDDEEEAQ
jgi:type IV pilus assembly protein PilO